VKILSPPHVVLAIGMVAVEIGALILIAARMNRESGKPRRSLEWLFLYVASNDLGGAAGAGSRIHSPRFPPYRHRVPVDLHPDAHRARDRIADYGLRRAATIVTAIYTVFVLGLLWILPLFPAQPKLARCCTR